jgi:hypothetical protein
MRIEIMIDKEQKISQATLTLLNPSFTEICALCIQKQSFVFEREAPTVLS